MSALAARTEPGPVWVLALAGNRYDRSPRLTVAERAVVCELAVSKWCWSHAANVAMARLTAPIDDVLAVVTPQAR